MQTDGRYEDDDSVFEEQLADIDLDLLAVPQSDRLRVDHFVERLNDVLRRAYEALASDDAYNDEQYAPTPVPASRQGHGRRDGGTNGAPLCGHLDSSI